MADAFDAPGTAKPFGIFSSAAWQPEGKVLHVAGQVAQDAAGALVGKDDIRAQTRQVLENLRTVLAAAGGTLDDVARVTVYVTDMSGLAQIHEVRGQYFRRPYPASTLVEVKRLVKPEYLIEIDAVAVIPADRVKRPA
ncbi:MAG: RidA family protein [Candidatus Rokubacteria bacterium]|nr:RidA family protein [Candidatus Rokubacteria bacterium]